MLTLIHTGFQEIYYNHDDSESLSIFKNLCPAKTSDEAVKYLKITRFFGFGVYNLIVAFFLIFIISGK